MTRGQTLAWTVAAAVCTASLVKAPAIAQAVEATLVRSKDEPGRNPYESTAIVNQNVNGLIRNPCSLHVCAASFAEVPAGKRLVMQNLTGFVRVAAGARLQFFSLAGDRGPAPQLSVFPVTEAHFTSDPASATDVYSFNHAAYGYVEPGQAPAVRVFGLGAFRFAGDASHIKLTGYLVDVQ